MWRYPGVMTDLGRSASSETAWLGSQRKEDVMDIFRLSDRCRL